ncbi:MAG: hypothetical protein ACTTIM_02335 [Campylobacter sp.]
MGGSNIIDVLIKNIRKSFASAK